MPRSVLVALLGLLTLCHAIQCPKQKTSPGREVVCYTSASDVGQLSDSVCRCTTLVHQGHDVRNLSTSDFGALRKSLKEINPPLQFVVSVDDPEKIVRTSGTIRQEATARLIRLLKEVDGVELNMTAGSKERLFHFVKGLKDEMVRKSYDKRVFLVLPTKPENLAKQFDLKELSKYVDLFTVPTHYLVDEDEAYHTFHPSRLMGLFDMINTDSLIDLISSLGAPKSKILVSVPASAYRFTLNSENDNAPRSPTKEKEPVVIDRKELCETMNKGEWTIERDEDLTAPYAFKNKIWIAFEDKISIGIKGKYALVRELPGLAIRDIENDFKTKCGKPITHEIHHSFTDFKRKSRAAVLNALEDDLHQAQINYADHVKSSDYRVVRVVDTEGHIRVVRENTQTEFSCTRQGYFVHPKSCNRFYRCVKFNQEVEDYSVFEFDCPAGLAFDESTEVCVWPGSLPEGSPCPGSSEIAPVTRVRFHCPGEPGYYADPQNGRWFFACIDLGGPELMAYEFRCPYGLVFDEQKLVCEWPWLVPGYSDSSYTRAQYENTGHSYGSSTPGVGGYYTGGLPHGFSGTTGSTGHGGSSGYVGLSTGTIGGHSGGSGFSGPAGVGYSGTTSGGSFGGGYSGSSGAAGYSGSTGSVGYSGSAGSTGYSGSTVNVHGGSDSGYTGSDRGSTFGGGYSGSGGSTGYTGSSVSQHGGSDYSGSTQEGTFGQGYSGSTGSVGYSGSIGHGGFTGSVGYSGSTGSTQYPGSVGYSGSSDSIGYSGSTATTHAGTDTQYSGITGSTDVHGRPIDYGSSSGTKYAGSSDDGYSKSTSGGYFGSTSGPYAGSSASHGGSIGGFGSSTGGVYSGSTSGAHAGSSSTGYSGSTGGDLYSGIGSGIHGVITSTGTVDSGQDGYSGTVFAGQGTDGGHYSGSTINVHQGSDGGHGGVAGTGYAGSSTGEYTGGYSGSTSGRYGGSSSGGYGGSTSGGYGGSTSGGYGGSTSGGYGGSTSGGYAGSTSGGYAGSTDGKYTGSISGGQTASTDGGYSGSFASSSAIGHAGSGTYTGTSSPGQGTFGIHGGYSGTSGSTYAGSGVTSQGEYSGQTQTKYTGSSGKDYSGISQAGYSGAGQTIPGSTPSPYEPTYSSSGPYDHRGQPGVTLPGQGQPSVSYLPSTPGSFGHGGVSSTSISDGQSHITSGFDIGAHGISTGSTYPGQQSVSTTYVGTSGVGGGYDTNDVNFSPGKGGVTSGSTVYYGTGGIKGGFGRPSGPSDLNITLIGSGIPSIGSTTYHGGIGSAGGYSTVSGSVGTGGIVSGHTIQGSIITDDSSSGTLITYGDQSGTVVTGPSDRGSVVTGGNQPGFIKSTEGTPGYVITNGVKTIYGGSASPGTVVHGTPTPGISISGSPTPGTFIRGQSSPGVLLTGQTAAGVSLGGSVEQGTVVGSTGGQSFSDSSFTTYRGSGGGVRTGSTYAGAANTGTVPVTYDTGYKTNEYYDNGGRGTIKFNNGYETTKYTENDILDYRPGGVTVPTTIVPGSSIGRTGGASFGSTVSGYSTSKTGLTSSGFTKTGPTRTGITTATLGGHGSYVISTGRDRPTHRPENIGPKAFEGNVVGYTKSSTESSVAGYSGTTSTESQDTSHIDTSKITLGPGVSRGYSYPKPSVQLDSGRVVSTPSTIAPTGGSVVTTPSPFLEVQMYNTPKGVGSVPVTSTPATVSTYSYGQGTDGQYRGSSGASRIPTGFSHRGPPTSTVAPEFYTTGPLENFKTTVFNAARIPVTVSTVQPVIDTGYKTVVSSTRIPVTLTGGELQGSVYTGSVSTHTQSDLEGGTLYQNTGYGDRKTYVSGTTPSPTVSIAPGYSTKSRRPYGPSTPIPSVTYEQPAVTVQPQINYVPSTVSTDTGYSYEAPRTSFGQRVTPSVSGSLKPQTQYLPTDSISPAVGVTFSKPFPVPGITYQSSTSQPFVPPVTSETYDYSGSFGSTYPSSSYSDQGFSSHGKTTFGTGIASGGSPTNVGIPRDEVGKLITNYDRGTAKYTPSAYDTYTGTGISSTTQSILSNDFSKSSSSFSSSSSGPSYIPSTQRPFVRTQKPAAVTTYSGGYSKPSSISSSYEVTTKPTTPSGRGKVIVKWSDLHPLLLGKLGAECTCKADPFANIRGPGRKLIASSKGQVDLSNYDESEVYVDLEKEAAYEDGDYVTNYESSTPGPIKVWNQDKPTLSVPTYSQTSGRPSSTYLPSVSSTVTPFTNPDSHVSGTFGDHSGVSVSAKGNEIFGTSVPFSGGYSGSHRSGKNLKNAGSSANGIAGEGAAFDRYGPGGLRDLDETLEGANDCARPGLFRHPNFCNKFYACHWDEWKKTFTLHVFNCPVHLTFDSGASACNWPSKGPACQDDNLLV